MYVQASKSRAYQQSTQITNKKLNQMTSIIETRRNKDIKTSKVKLPEEISKLYKSDFKSRETQLIIMRDGFKYFPLDN